MTTQRTRTAVAAFDSRDQAERAVDALRAAGFADETIGWAMRHEEKPEGVEDATKGAAAGAVTGGVVGGVAAAAAMALIPGVGPFIGGGVLATVLAGAGVGAAAGGLIGALTGLGLSEDEATYYEGEFKAGRALVTVDAGARYTEAADILRRMGGRVHQPEGAARPVV
jgi:hypothetical protein